MAEYRLLTVWRIAAPLEQVYAAIHDSLRWPEWWPGVLAVEQGLDGDAVGIGSVRHYSWRGNLPYRLKISVHTTRIDQLAMIEGIAHGDLEGTGRWQFSRHGEISVVRYEWHVRSTRWWMNLLAPLARALFIRNHVQVMEQGGIALARRLGGSLVGMESRDLLVENNARHAPFMPLRERGKIDPRLALVSGLAAGVLATLAQLALWWLAGVPLLETLYRDVRLTAALAMGAAVLPPPLTPQWDILLVATAIHFALAVIYALLPAHLAPRLGNGAALLGGALYGLAIYAINLYGFTLLFPWFAVARDWATLGAHLVFGVTLAGGCRLWAAKHQRGLQA